MAKYLIDGAIFSTKKAQKSWEEDTRWDGRNHISAATGSQWRHQTLYLSSKGRYWIESTSQYQGEESTAETASAQEAARWLILNGHELPMDLADQEDVLVE